MTVKTDIADKSVDNERAMRWEIGSRFDAIQHTQSTTHEISVL